MKTVDVRLAGGPQRRVWEGRVARLESRARVRARIKRHLRDTTLTALDVMVDCEPGELRRRAAELADDLRGFVESLEVDGTPAGEVRRQARCALHDTTLQLLEYIASDGYGAQLEPAELGHLVHETRADVRRVIGQIGCVGTCGDLYAGLCRLAEEARRDGLLDVRLVKGRIDGSLDPGRAADLVAAAREALNNVRKHARATTVIVRCEQVDGTARVSIVDNGIGFGPGGPRPGLGVRDSIVERMTHNGGRATLTAGPGGGACVTLALGIEGP